MAKVNLTAVKVAAVSGIVLQVLAVVPYLGIFAGVIGIALLVWAHKKLSDLTGDKTIFLNTWLSYLVGVLSALFAYLLPLIVAVKEGAPTPAQPPDAVRLAVVLVVILGFALAGYLLFKVYTKLAKYFGIKFFRWAAYLIFVGYLITPILPLGVFVAFAGWILATLGYLELPSDFENFSKSKNSAR